MVSIDKGFPDYEIEYPLLSDDRFSPGRSCDFARFERFSL